jgi:hypothetical protein
MNDIMYEVIKYKIKYDNSKRFTLEELNKISEYLGISLQELADLLEIKQHMLYELKRETYYKAKSNAYEDAKKSFFEEISEDVLNDILKTKIKDDFTSKFTYSEMEELEKRFEINKKDLLRNILGIKDLRNGPKSIDDNGYFHSLKYKEYKDNALKRKGDEILRSFLPLRMKKTGNHMFTYIEIKELCEIYGINPRDFMVYVLGKSEQLYYDCVAKRQDRCYSQKYKQEKEKLIISKKESFMEDINPNVRTYFSLKQLEELANKLEISVYDLVTGVMGKSRQTCSQIVNRYEQRPGVYRKRLYVGEHKSCALPTSFCKKNIEEIMAIIKIATRSAIGFMKDNGFKGVSNFYYDIMQEGYLYLVSSGNPISKEGNPTITTDKYDDSYGSIFYKKMYFYAIAKIKEFTTNEISGQAYDINLKINGTSDDLIEEYEEDVSVFINGLTADKKEQEILRFFSINSLNDKSLKAACDKFNVTQDCINGMFAKMRETLTKGQSRDDD